MRSDAVFVAPEAQAAARVWLMPRGRGGGCARRTPIPVARPGCRRSERWYGERWQGQGFAGTQRGTPAPAGTIIFCREAELHAGLYPSPATTRVWQSAHAVTCAATDPEATGD